ncbi:MAG: hypothetical protein K0R57_1935 [Paenibacillaceae bacterium]|jgi:hypothetical protein|nr:hypothetical protein [Paenibacillaceae bacterium]
MRRELRETGNCENTVVFRRIIRINKQTAKVQADYSTFRFFHSGMPQHLYFYRPDRLFSLYSGKSLHFCSFP